MGSAAGSAPAAGDDPLFDPLSAFAASSSYTSSQRSSRPGTSHDDQTRPSGIEASAGRHYFDLKALQSSLQSNDTTAAAFPKATSSVRDSSAGQVGYDGEDDGGKTPGERRPRLIDTSEGRYEKGGAEDDETRSQSEALTPRSSMSALRGQSPSGQPGLNAQTLPASRPTGLQSPYHDRRSDSRLGKRPSESGQTSRPPSRANAPSSPFFPSEPRPNSRAHQNLREPRDLYEEPDDGDAASASEEDETGFLSRLHLMSDAELQRLMGATIRPGGSPRQLSPSFSRPSLATVQAGTPQHSLSSPVLGEVAMFAQAAKLQEMESVELCRKLSRALAEALSEVTDARQSLREQQERFATQMDAMKRRSETREEAMYAVCLQHGIAAGTIDRAVARALADMPQVSINVEEQVKTLAQRTWLSAPDTPAYPSTRRSSVHSRSAGLDGERRPRSAASAAEMIHEPSLPVSLQEAMLDEFHVGGSSGIPVSSDVRLSAKARAASLQQGSAKDARPDLGTTQSASRSSDGTSSALPTPSSSHSEAAVSFGSSRRSTTGSSPISARRSSSRAVDGLLPWNNESKDRKAIATTQSTLVPAVNADSAVANTYTPASLGSTTLPSVPSLRTSSSNPGFFSSFGWKRGKKGAPPVPVVPDTVASPSADGKVLDQAKSAPLPLGPSDQSTSVQSVARVEAPPNDSTSIHPQLDRTSSGTDVISALHEAIGSAPVSPSEHPAHHIDLKALPKPPSVKAIFLATRILGNDASSLLQNRGRKISQQVAQKAVDVVKNSLDEGLHIDEPPNRGSSQQTTIRRPSGTQPPVQRESARSTERSECRPVASASIKQKQRAQSVAAQAAAAIVESASGPGTAAVGRLSGRRSEVRLPSRSRVEPNVTRLPRQIGYGSTQHRAPSLADRTAAEPRTPSKGPPGVEGEAGLPVELEAIVPFDGKPPTLALFSQTGRRPTRAPISNGDNDDESSGDEFEVYGGKGNLVIPQPVRSSAIGFDDRAVDVFGFVYDATPADVRLLRQARKASTPAPACLTGIRVGVAARGGSDRQSGSEADEADTDTDADSIIAKEESTSEDMSHTVTDAMPATPSKSTTEPADSSPETSPVRLLGIARGRPSTETSQVSASSGLEAGPTSPGQEREFQLSSDPSKAPEGHDEEPTTTTGTSKTREPKATSETVRHLLDQLKVMHSQHQEVQKAKWDAFIQHRRTVMTRSAENASGTQDRDKEKKSLSKTARGLLADGRTPNAEDQYHHGLIGVRLLGDDKSGKEDRKQFLRLVQEGIPLAHRPKIWAECSGASEVAEPGLFQDLLNEHASESNPCLVQIDLDVHRTMPTNIYFGGDGPGVPKLRRVLAAYSWYNPSTGYCQGMNNLAATLLLTHATEEEAFWVLVCIIDKILPEDYYTSHLLVSQADQRVLIDLVRELIPKLADHLEDLGVDLPAVTFAWFLSLYTDCLPVETLFRVWDLLFVEGMIILFRVAVAILMMNEKELIATTSPAAFYGHVHSMTSRLFSVDRLLQLACQDLRNVVTEEKVLRRRRIHIADIKDELGLAE
ncbi:TBC-domain-containing protein [Microstroma glucosiphilum]|uniref:TBC-domain-containing protein n=1 Tax=Pseudomicrostroma glucosiphilum TaxID=1684307 RepID=A0A316UB74_9BASI|nr:TBC-domain-containing protein [Pseudomicrostroma glucosiphilum]PWN22480.1 TBC-domain-containing protein [Pseudomicrostroma glucosiphilum]